MGQTANQLSTYRHQTWREQVYLPAVVHCHWGLFGPVNLHTSLSYIQSMVQYELMKLPSSLFLAFLCVFFLVAYSLPLKFSMWWMRDTSKVTWPLCPSGIYHASPLLRNSTLLMLNTFIVFIDHVARGLTTSATHQFLPVSHSLLAPNSRVTSSTAKLDDHSSCSSCINLNYFH